MREISVRIQPPDPAFEAFLVAFIEEHFSIKEKMSKRLTGEQYIYITVAPKEFPDAES